MSLTHSPVTGPPLPGARKFHLPLALGIRRILSKAFSFPVMLVAWIVLVVVHLAERNLPDPDIWWHLRNAQYLFTNHHLPNVEAYSFTVAGQPWMNPEWVAEIPYYLAWRALGLEGIEVVMLLALEAIFILLVFLSYERSHRIKAAILACWFAIALGTINFGPRTILFGYLYLVVLLIILERFRSRGHAPLWLLPALFCLWINTHGSWAIGIIVFGIYIASGFFEGEWGRIKATRWSLRQQRQLIFVFALSCAALLANPYGYHLLLYPANLAFRQRLNIASIQEWVSVDFHGPQGKVALVLLAVLFCSALASRYQWKLSDLLLTLFGFYCGLTYERFLFLAGIIVAPTLAEMLHFVPPYRPEIDKPWLNAAIIAGVSALVVYRFPAPPRLKREIARQYPAGAVRYLKRHDLPGRALNFYNWGGYLGWKDPKFKVFVDSRVDVFERAGVFSDYLKVQTMQDPERILDKYRIRYVLFPSSQPLIYLLKISRGWKVLYSGKISTLLERATAMPLGLVKRTTIGRNPRPQ